jgi:hypothetical protein
LQGVDAVEALLEAEPNTPTYMIGVQENKITRVPLMDAVKMVFFHSSLVPSALDMGRRLGLYHRL